MEKEEYIKFCITNYNIKTPDDLQKNIIAFFLGWKDIFEDDFEEFLEALKNIYTKIKIISDLKKNDLVSSQINQILNYIEEEKIRLNIQMSVAKNYNNVKRVRSEKLRNSKKLALLTEMGVFELPIMKKLSEDSQNEIIALLLDADKKEFVYKNRLNINSKKPSYQIDKYTSYCYLDEMRKLLNDMQ